MHDILFRQQQRWAPLEEPGELLLSYADSIGADRAGLEACTASGATRGEIALEAQAMFQSGARSTPTFIIEGAMLSGAAPIEAWRAVLDSILRTKESTRP